MKLHKNSELSAETARGAVLVPCQRGTATPQVRIVPVAIVALLAYFVLALSAGAQPAVSSNRFLFIIDASASMKPLGDSLRETVFDLVYSGARGQMTNGDTYGIWVVNEHNDTSFPMEVWKAKHAVESAARAAVHVKERGFKGRARLDVAVADAMAVIRNVEDLTVILVSNGETPLSGTPFDADINEKFRELALPMKRAKATLNTALVAQEGTFAAWGINAPEFLLDVPYVAPKPKKAKVEVAVKTNAAPAGATPMAKAEGVPPATKPVEVIAQKPRAAHSAIVITKETVANERRSYQAMTAAAVSNDTFAVATTTNEVTPAVPTNLTPAVVATTHATTAVTSNVVARMTNPTAPALVAQAIPPPASNAVASLSKAETTNAAVAAVPTAPSPAKPLPAATTIEATAASGYHPMVWAAFGAGLALAGVLAVFFVIRSRRVEPSLISEAIAQERLNQQSTSVRP